MLSNHNKLCSGWVIFLASKVRAVSVSILVSKKKKREEIAVFSKKEKSHEGLLRMLFSRRGEAVAALTSKQLWEATAYLHNLGSHSFHQAVHRGLQVTGREPSLMV